MHLLQQEESKMQPAKDEALGLAKSESLVISRPPAKKRKLDFEDFVMVPVRAHCSTVVSISRNYYS